MCYTFYKCVEKNNKVYPTSDAMTKSKGFVLVSTGWQIVLLNIT